MSILSFALLLLLVLLLLVLVLLVLFLPVVVGTDRVVHVARLVVLGMVSYVRYLEWHPKEIR